MSDVLALYRCISIIEGVFVLQNEHRLPAEFIACLRLEIAFQIKKLLTKW